MALFISLHIRLHNNDTVVSVVGRYHPFVAGSDDDTAGFVHFGSGEPEQMSDREHRQLVRELASRRDRNREMPI